MTEKSAIYFISDLHLESTYPDLIRAFEVFLEQASKDAKAIYILGDFFNAWIGDDDNSRFVLHIQSLLRQYADLGIALFFIHGNRDFLVGEKFAHASGMTILDEGSEILLFGTPTLLLHGDSLCTDDIAYQAFRTKVRDPAWQREKLAYPLWLRRMIARYYRWRSNNANQNKAEYILDVNQQAVEQAFVTSGTSLMIHGHTHRPGRHDYDIDRIPRERIVLGDWGVKVWYLKVTEQAMDLVSYDLLPS
ncbi:UDP-2,3-diacylglucosamine hydrolase [Thalassocella blandensis]|nr:UDP-2,3-diacylglucosamine hydrolase [Thalassocella blandensis]